MTREEIALQRIDAEFDGRIDTQSTLALAAQDSLAALIAEKEARVLAVREYIVAEIDNVRIDAILANKPVDLP